MSDMDRYERLRRLSQIGDRIRLGGLDIEQIAEHSGVDPRTIRNYAEGTVERPKAETVRKLMEAVGIKPSDPLASEAEATDVIAGLLQSLPVNQRPALLGRLIEEAVRFITSDDGLGNVVEFPGPKSSDDPHSVDLSNEASAASPERKDLGEGNEHA